jgi:hypothetical protein
MNVVAIVEGDGEVRALPALLRRFTQWRATAVFPNVVQPIRVRRDRFLNNVDEFRKQVTLAGMKCQRSGWVLILLDADDDCPVTLADAIYRRLHALVPHIRVSVVIAKHEYEAWFIAAAPSLSGKKGFNAPINLPAAESVRGAKELVGKCMPHGRKYHEVSDQEAFSAVLDLQLAYDNSRSFRKLASEWDKQMAVVVP